MWYGLLGSKELFQRSYRKLEERVHLEVSGKEGNMSWTWRKEISLLWESTFPYIFGSSQALTLILPCSSWEEGIKVGFHFMDKKMVA